MNPSIPADADGTIWGLRFAQGIGAASSDRAQRARQFLQRHAHPAGGLATFSEDEFRRFTGQPSPSGVVRNWFDVHTCVTAAAGGLDGMENSVRPHLRQTQREDGSWKGYWWEDDEYATALAAEALAMTNEAGDQRRVQSAVSWALARVNSTGAVPSLSRPSGSAIATALGLRTLALAEDPRWVRDIVQRSLHWLLAQQRPDASWEPAATFYANPDEVPVRPVWECRGVFTTATVISALRAVRG